jgi:hypothetical protein
MRTVQGLTALFLLIGITTIAESATNLLEDVRLRHETASRMVDDVTMEHRFIGGSARGKIVDAKVTEWVKGWKWRREYLWEDEISSLEKRVMDKRRYTQRDRKRTIRVTTTVLCDGYDTWVITERPNGVTVQTVSDASLHNPESSFIDYSPPLEPYLRYLPDYGESVGTDRLYGKFCVVAATRLYEDESPPESGTQQILTTYIDRETMTVLRMEGSRYIWPNSRLDSIYVQIDNTVFADVQNRFGRTTLPRETIIRAAGQTETITSYWYNAGLSDGMFDVNQVVVMHGVGCPGHRIPYPPLGTVIICTLPGSKPNPPSPRPPKREHPDPVVKNPGPVTKDPLPPTKPKPKPAPKPKPKPKPEPVNKEVSKPKPPPPPPSKGDTKIGRTH